MSESSGSKGQNLKIQNHKDLYVWQLAMDSAMHIYEATKKLPTEEKYSLVDQIRRSSRSVAANIAEAWRKRRYEAAFVAKLSDAEAEACETQTWLEFCKRCGYLPESRTTELDRMYDDILGKLIAMINGAKNWTIIKTKDSK
ncbi:MAG TPA: four helix bundle protein [Desulfuromonadales bacterium]|nr:four helix bundle protein [Desulfuromonadales bacterium]